MQASAQTVNPAPTLPLGGRGADSQMSPAAPIAQWSPLAPGAQAAFEELLARAREVAATVLAPSANFTDQGDFPPTENYRALGEAGVLGVTTPVEYGGSAAPPEIVRQCIEILAGACGVTTFGYIQHVTACRHLAGGENETARAQFLPEFASGRKIASTAFSHIRRLGKPTLRVDRDGDGFVFNGKAPWMTGWGLADETLLAGTTSDGGSIWVVAPLQAGEALQPSPPMHMCTMNAAVTVSLTCSGFRVGPERFVKAMAAEQLAADTGAAILLFSVLSIGVTTGAVALLRTMKDDFAQYAAEAFDREVNEARARVDRAFEEADQPGFHDLAMQVRAWCIDLGVRAAHATVAATGGGANSRNHAAQRLFREAMLYTLTSQTEPLQAATIERLVRRGGFEEPMTAG